MMKSEYTASFLFSLAKRGRKYFLGIATVTQDVEDFLGSPYGLPIITNSSIQLLMKQSPSSIEMIQKVFNLTNEEKYLLLESSVGEGIFFAGSKHVAIKTVPARTRVSRLTLIKSAIRAKVFARISQAVQRRAKQNNRVAAVTAKLAKIRQTAAVVRPLSRGPLRAQTRTSVASVAK
jgi:hypothetical protein